jgi:hypothetical protein
MPSFIPHYICAISILENFGFNHNDFILGNLLPDADDGTDDDHARSHFRKKIDGKFERFTNLEAFKDRYHNHFDNDLVLGYYCHLICDTVWRRHKPEKPPNIDDSAYKKLVHDDFVRLNTKLIEHYKLDAPARLTIPDSIIVSEIDRGNIPCMLDHFTQQFEGKAEGDLVTITLDFMLSYIDSAVKLCAESLALSRFGGRNTGR